MPLCAIALALGAAPFWAGCLNPIPDDFPSSTESSDRVAVIRDDQDSSGVVAQGGDGTGPLLPAEADAGAPPAAVPEEDGVELQRDAGRDGGGDGGDEGPP